MGNCAGCTGPQRRRFQVQRIEQNSPIKSRLSNGKKYYPNNSQVQQYPYTNGKDKINENQMYLNTFNLGFSKTNSATQLGISYANANSNVNNNNYNYNNTNNSSNNIINPNDNNNFTYNILNQVAKTHIKLYPDNPQLQRDSITKLQKSYVNSNNQNDFYNNQLGSSSHRSINNNNIITNTNNNSYNNMNNNLNNNNNNLNNNINTLSANPLIRSIHSQSKRILQQSSYSNQKTPLKLQSVYNTNQFKTQQVLQQRPIQYESPLASIAISRYDETSTKMNKNYQNQKYQSFSSELPFKKYSKYHKNLTVIEEMLQQDHKTPIEIKKQRKKNGEDVIYDHLDELPEQLQSVELPNFQEYLPVLEFVIQKG